MIVYLWYSTYLFHICFLIYHKMIIFIYPIYGIKQIHIYGIQTNSIYGRGGLLRNEKGSVVMSFITYFGIW